MMPYLPKAPNPSAALPFSDHVPGETRMRVLAIFILVFSIAMAAYAAELQVFAAASLTDALKEIGFEYQKETGTKIFFNFAASNVLALQIAEGSGADLFFSADEEKMDWLQEKNLILNNSRRSLLSNTLVIVIPADSNETITDPQTLSKLNWKIALAEPKTVPAGIYAKKYLQKVGLWSKLVDRIIPTENVRAALAAVESGNVDAGIVYKTDAQISHHVKIAYEIPIEDCPDISYPIAIIRESKNIDEASRFKNYLQSSKAVAIFKRYGFILSKG
jgi:molybdate transport system substrate-binding protein